MTELQAAPPAAAAPRAVWLNTTLTERLLGLVVVASIGYVAMALGGAHPQDLLGIPEAVMMFAIVTGGLVISHGMGAIGKLFAVAFGASCENGDQREALRGLCTHGRRRAWAAAAVVMAIGVMHVLSVLDQPSLIGPGLAATLRAPIYAVVLGELGFGGARCWVAKR